MKELGVFKRRHASAFLADQQLADVLDTLSLDFYQGKDTTTIQNGFTGIIEFCYI